MTFHALWRMQPTEDIAQDPIDYLDACVRFADGSTTRTEITKLGVNIP